VEQNQVMAETENEAHFLPMLFKVKTAATLGHEPLYR
jgi:hypothetical protein